MTFLEFIVRRELGEPNRNGKWLCPFHGESNPSFTLFPPKAGCKDRFKCWSCGAWGDEFDLLKELYPDEDYSARLLRMEQLGAQYRDAQSAPKPKPISNRGAWSHNTQQAMERNAYERDPRE